MKLKVSEAQQHTWPQKQQEAEMFSGRGFIAGAVSDWSDTMEAVVVAVTFLSAAQDGLITVV